MIQVKRDDILKFLNDIYMPSFSETDRCYNGLQVEGSNTITGIVTGVSYSKRLIEEAVKRNANMIVCHHGVFQNDLELQIKGFFKERLRSLLISDINLVGYHLPMDVHMPYGHNYLACQKLGLSNIEKCSLGFIGEYSESIDISELRSKIESLYEREVALYPFGKTRISKVAVISGGASSYFKEPYAMEADVFITGDMSENLVRKYEEMQFNVINAGHYHTERLGVIEITRLLRDNFNIPCEFVEVLNYV